MIRQIFFRFNRVSYTIKFFYLFLLILVHGEQTPSGNYFESEITIVHTLKKVILCFKSLNLPLGENCIL